MSLLNDSKDPKADEGTARNFSGWIAFAVLMVFVMIALAAPSTKKKERSLDGYEADQAVLKEVLSAESLEKSIGGSIPKSQLNSQAVLAKSLDDPISGLVLASDKDPLAAMLYAEMRTYQKRSVPIEHLRILKSSKFPEDRAFYTLYSAPNLTQKETDDLIAKLPGQAFVYKVARVQALERVGDKNAVIRYISPVTSIGTVILAIGAWPFLGASVAIWMILMRRHRENKLEPRGIPLESITDHDADRLAIRAAQVFAIFILTGLLVLFVDRGLKLHLNDEEMTAAAGILTVLSIFGLQHIPIDGKKVLLSVMGLSAGNLKKDIGLGIVGFIAEFPVAIILGQLCAVLFSWLPKPSHPAEILEHTHDLRVVIPVAISACLIAPFWEEITFRGLLFPGAKRLLGGIVPGILVSSFLFASVHPQGVAEWVPLAFVGASSCYLSYQSRSLIPGIVMHCLHNTVLVVIMLLST